MWPHALLLSQVIIQCRQSERHHGFSCTAVNGCFAAHCFLSSHVVFLPPFTFWFGPHRDRSLTRRTDQAGTAGWRPLASSLRPRYRAGVEQSRSRTPWRGCSVENRRWSPTAKRQLPGECCYEDNEDMIFEIFLKKLLSGKSYLYRTNFTTQHGDPIAERANPSS